MTSTANPDLDLTIARIIEAPRSAVWAAWTDPRRFEQWWVPHPTKCRVLEMELRPGGAFRTEMSGEDGGFKPHMSGCILDVEPKERIVFTDALLGGWRPAEKPFMTAIITLKEHPAGTDYVARVLHRSRADRVRHEELGFYDGWTTVTEQLAALAESAAHEAAGRG